MPGAVVGVELIGLAVRLERVLELGDLLRRRRFVVPAEQAEQRAGQVAGPLDQGRDAMQSTAASSGRLTAARNACRPPEQWPITPTLPLELLSPRRYAAAPATSPTIRSSGMGIAPAARAAAIASSGAAPGASR